MKNTILIFVTILLFLTSTVASGQNEINPNFGTNHNQLNLFSAEVMSLVNIVMMDAHRFNLNDELSADPPNKSTVFNKSDDLQINLLSEFVSSNLAKKKVNEATFYNNFVSKKNRSFELIAPLKSSVNCISVMCITDNIKSTNTPNNNSWKVNSNVNLPSELSSLGSWNFNIGHIEDMNR